MKEVKDRQVGDTVRVTWDRIEVSGTIRKVDPEKGFLVRVQTTYGQTTKWFKDVSDPS